MEGRLVFKNAALRRGARILRGQSVVVEDETIAKIDDDVKVPSLPGDWVVPCAGRMVTVGRLDAHAHLCAAQVNRDENEVALTIGEVDVLSAHALARQLRDGITCTFEQLRVPERTDEAIDAQQRCAERLNARLISAGEVRESEHTVLEQVLSVAKSRPGAVMVATGEIPELSSTFARELVRQSGDASVRLHFHLAVEDTETDDSLRRHHLRPFERAAALGLLSAKSIAAGLRTLSAEDAAALKKLGALAVIAPWHASSFVGEPCERGVATAVAAGLPLALGTGGAGNFAVEASTAWATAKDAIFEALDRGYVDAHARLGLLASAEVAVGSVADLLVLELVPPAVDRLAELRASVSWTIVGGRVVVREGQLLTADPTVLAREAARVVEAIWARG